MITSQKFPTFLLFITIMLFALDVYLVLATPPSATSTKLGLSSSLISRALLNLSFTIPLFTSLFLGSWSGLLLLNQPKFRLFAQSTLALTLVLVIGTMLGAVRSHFFFSDIYGGYKILTLLINALYSWGYLAGFFLIFISVKKLLPKEVDKWNVGISIVITLLIGTFYTAMILTNPDRLVTTSVYAKPTHFLSDLSIILTIILPTISGWFFAILAAFSLADASGVSNTSIQQESLRKILYGTLFIVFSIISLQAILSIGTTRFLASGLVFTLGIIYIFVFMLATGNILVLKGAKKLTQI